MAAARLTGKWDDQDIQRAVFGRISLGMPRSAFLAAESWYCFWRRPGGEFHRSQAFGTEERANQFAREIQIGRERAPFETLVQQGEVDYDKAR